MKVVSVFEFKNYIDFLTAYLKQLPHQGHGEKTHWADAIQCHNAYLSKILKKEAHLSHEQAFALCKFLNFSPEETDFMLLLVQYSRAGTEILRKHYFQKIQSIEQARIQLRNRFSVNQDLSPEDRITYFSEWYYPVIHLMLVTLKRLRSLRDIESALSLSSEVVQKSVQFLEKIGVIEKVGNQYKAGQVNIHLGSDSPMISTYHSQWRNQAIRSLEKKSDHDLHYSNIVTIHKKDFEAIRKLLVSSIEGVRDQVANSKDEDSVAVLTLDWFEL